MTALSALLWLVTWAMACFVWTMLLAVIATARGHRMPEGAVVAFVLGGTVLGTAQTLFFAFVL